ncbi:translation initiation factor IF-2, putative [Cyanobium sp. PCC 7001]|uniref:translation initiation factor IF-2 n=1 Tax=Cyanobium sp. PCC 7001 TaxID=180281 RepID=UPI00018055B2|nr:translation initiation factor IF-2 [Cyanobium sp. PCC 7001]EDY37147.1 translation initiation factor IF-2, putative [Cyanobium sp. PCC 7001]
MTSSGKVRIYELSRDLGLENKDVLDAAEKLGVAAKSHSSSISDDEAARIRRLIETGGNGASQAAPAPPSPPGKAILSVKKAAAPVRPEAPARPAPPQAAPAQPSRPAAPSKPMAPARPAAPAPGSAGKPAMGKPVAKPSPKPVAKPAAAAPTPPQPVRPAPVPPPARPGAAPSRPGSQAPVNRPGPAAKPAPPARPPVVIASRPSRPGTPAPSRKPEPPSRPGGGRPQLVGRPISPQGGSNRPAPPGSRPATSQRPAPPQRSGAPSPSRPGQGGGRPAATPLELVGKPIRRDSSGGNRPAAPGRPGMPAGMRKPMAPGELMQLQKPTGRTPAPPPRRPGDRSEAGSGPGGTPDLVRPTATPPSAPRRPGFRAPVPAGRPRRPDWDDSAKLEALRSRTPQRQRPKVHIIGDNDDALTAETGGYAGEQEAVVLQASLARPSKPKTRTAPAPRPTVAVRKRKKETTRQRQRRRAMELRASREAKQQRPEMLIVPEGNLTVQELAEKLGVESSDIIKSLFFKGIIATVTQSLDLSTIEAVSEEFGVPVLEDDVEEAAAKTVEMIEESDLEHLIRRPPVVTVMGHVDHGKTSLLDAIRKTRVAAGEAGGITQHIGAYQVEIEHGGEPRKLTFLDTPGHEAFTAMRARGTKVTDVAVLVVAADDGVRPQTLEAISHARAAKVPIVVAINKIDKEGASPERVKQELSGLDLVAEDWGGTTVMVPVSAIKAENVDKLLEMILLQSELEDLQANPDRMAKGTVIEAHLDKAKGPVATLLVQNGTLRPGDVLAAGPVLGKVRAMVDDTGKRVKQAGPSLAVEALGFSEVPTAGDEFEVFPDEKTARAVVGDRATEARATRLAQQMASRRVSLASMSGQASEGELKELNLILKADVQGSVEAILGSLEQLPQGEVQVRVLLSAPGEITETDVDLAAASGAVIVGFNTSMAPGAKRAADATGVDVRDYDVIYKLLEDIQLAMEGLLEPELVEESLGEAEVRAVFTIGKSAVAGCYVTTGKLQRNCRIRVRRAKEIVFEGDLDSLRRNKDDVKEVATGFECGIGCDRFTGWQEGDRVEAFKLVTQRRTLTT